MMKKVFLLFFYCLLSLNLHAEPLPANEAFQLEIEQFNTNQLILKWQIKPGYFLYQDRIKITEFADSNNVTATIQFIPPLEKVDKAGNVYKIYRGNVSLPVIIKDNVSSNAPLLLHYQGCADEGFCYPPATKKINVAVIKQYWLLTIISFFGLGLLLSFTPCILPMIPVLSGIIVGQGNTISSRRGFLLSTVYVLSMACTYALAGAAIALLGKNIQVMMQSAWAIGLLSLIYAALALSMFDVFALKLPSSWQASLTKTNTRLGGSYWGVALMGSLSMLILSPCVTPPLIAALSYIAQSGKVFFGSACLFFLGLGMGSPLIIIGTSAAYWLPKAGRWMQAVKAFFGVILLIMAAYLLTRVLPDAVTIYQPKPPSTSAIYSVNTTQELNKRLTTVAAGRLVILEFSADWCITCKIFKNSTLKNSEVIQTLKNFIFLKADVSAYTPKNQQLMQEYNVIAPPAFIFFTKDRQEIKEARLIGEVSTKEFLAHLQELEKNF